MIGLSLKSAPNISILCLGAHSDDLEIGCGGTLLHLAEMHPDASVHWIVFSSGEQRAKEATESAYRLLEPFREKRVLVLDYRTSFFPYIGVEIKEQFELLKAGNSPDIIFTHYRHDLHQDHRLISELTWNTFRDHLILEYEIPKYDGDLGSPNLFVPLSQEQAERKIRHVLTYFKTQESKHWFTEDAFSSILRIRGLESRAKYAEAFYCRKVTLS